MNDYHEITTRLDTLRPTLAGEERALLWQRIAPHIGAAVPSPYGRMLHKKGMAAAMIVLVALTAGGTVAAAQPARPGDVLFPVDQASERALLFVTPEAKREALRERFMEERFYELDALFDDAAVSVEDGVLAWSNGDELEVEADVFNDVTVVKIERNDDTRYFTTSATTRESVAEAAAARYGLPYEAILSVMEFSVEDRVSRPRDRGMLAPEKQSDIASAVAVVLDEMDGHDEDKREVFVARFMEEYDELAPFVNDDRVIRYRERDDEDRDDDKYEERSGDNRIKIDDDKMEIRSGGVRIRSDDDGTIEIKVDDDSDEDEDFNEDSSEEDDHSSNGDDDRFDDTNDDNEDSSQGGDHDDDDDNSDRDGEDDDDKETND